MLHEDIIHSVRNAWGIDTCYPKEVLRWSKENSAVGQCAVTALLVQDLIGGSIIFCTEFNHYWNKGENGEEIDLTRDQFSPESELETDQGISRNEILNSPGAIDARTQERYEILKTRFLQLL